MSVLQPQHCRNNTGLGCSPFARHYLGNHYCFIFLRVLRCFSSPGSPPVNGISRLQRDGLPHSEISGSKVVCTSPKLFAAYHVLHRLWEPRHPPCALTYFLVWYSMIYFPKYFHSWCQRTSGFRPLSHNLLHLPAPLADVNGFEPLFYLQHCIANRFTIKL